jgi:hypothetical protein
MLGPELRGERNLSFERDGAELYPAALRAADLEQLRTFGNEVLNGRSGVRLFGGPMLDTVLGPTGSLGRLAVAALGAAARPVRAIMFDKTESTNWAVHWHQDRTIAVKERRDVPGFETWTRKAGVNHVEPPFDVIARMVTLRAHLDDCDAHNAPLLIAPGSHKVGRIPEPEIDRTVAKLGQVACLAEAGDVWLYATALLHASERARKPRRRRVLHVDFSAMDLPAGLEWLGDGSAYIDRISRSR